MYSIILFLFQIVYFIHVHFSHIHGQTTATTTTTTVATKYIDLPPPYCQYENLYFIESETKFISIENLSEGKSAQQHCFPSNSNIKELRGFIYERVDLSKSNSHSLFISPNTSIVFSSTLFFFEMVETSHMIRHFFHIFEHLLGTWSFFAENHRNEVELIVLAADGSLEEWTIPDLSKTSLKALFPNAKLLIWKEFREIYRGKKLHFQQIFISDRYICNFENNCGARLNKMLGVARNTISPSSIDRLSKLFHQHYGSKLTNIPGIVRITYVTREMPRRLSPELEDILLDRIRNISHVMVNVVDFAKLVFAEQVSIAGNTDILLGVHGNGLSHILFLPNNASVIEMFPPKAHHLDYRVYSEVRGLEHFSVLPVFGLISKESAYHLAAFGPPKHTIVDIDIDLIIGIIRVQASKFRSHYLAHDPSWVDKIDPKE